MPATVPLLGPVLTAGSGACVSGGAASGGVAREVVLETGVEGVVLWEEPRGALNGLLIGDSVTETIVGGKKSVVVDVDINVLQTTLPPPAGTLHPGFRESQEVDEVAAIEESSACCCLLPLRCIVVIETVVFEYMIAVEDIRAR